MPPLHWKKVLIRVQGGLELAGLGLFAHGYFLHSPLTYWAGGALLLLDYGLAVASGALNPLAVIILGAVLSILMTPWHAGALWSMAGLSVLNVPGNLIKLVDPERVLKKIPTETATSETSTIDVGVQLAAHLHDAANSTAAQVIRDLRDLNLAVSPPAPQALLRECTFVALHLTDRAARRMWQRSTADLFMPMIVNTTLGMMVGSQKPDLTPAEAAAEAKLLLPAFDAANAALFEASFDAPSVPDQLAKNLPFVFARRVATASSVQLSGEATGVLMRAVPRIYKDANIEEHLSRISQRGP